MLVLAWFINSLDLDFTIRIHYFFGPWLNLKRIHFFKDLIKLYKTKGPKDNFNDIETPSIIRNS